MPSTACVFKNSSGSLPDYCFEIIIRTRPRRVISRLRMAYCPLSMEIPSLWNTVRWINPCALEFLSDARHGPRRDRPYRLGFRAAWQSWQSAYGAFKGGVIRLIQLKYPGPERAAARCRRAGLKTWRISLSALYFSASA